MQPLIADFSDSIVNAQELKLFTFGSLLSMLEIKTV